MALTRLSSKTVALAKIFTVGQVILLVYCLTRAYRDGVKAILNFGVLVIAGLITCIWSVFSVEGHIFSYLVQWISVFGWLMWFPPLILLGKLRIWERDKLKKTKIVLAGVLVLVFVSGAIPFAASRLADPPNSDTVRALSAGIIAYLNVHKDRPVTIDFDWNEWPLHTGVILAIYKAGIPFYVNTLRTKHGRNWPLLFESKVFYPPNETSRISIVKHAEGHASTELISAHCGYFVYLTK